MWEISTLNVILLEFTMLSFIFNQSTKFWFNDNKYVQSSNIMVKYFILWYSNFMKFENDCVERSPKVRSSKHFIRPNLMESEAEHHYGIYH